MRLQPVHRARRFVAVATSPGPGPADRAWAGEWLDDAEGALFDRLRGADRAHSIAVARAVAGDPGPDGARAPRWVVSAALLHDVGKADADLGVLGRSVATVLGWLGGPSVGRWLGARPWRGPVGRACRAVGRYIRYPELGAAALAAGGSDPRVVAWAREHHRPEADWTVPVAWGRVLRDADDAAG